VEVGIRELRAHLSRYIEQVNDGEDIVVTDRGIPVARIVPMNGERKIDRLIAAGLVEPAPRAVPRPLPKPIKIEGGISELVDEQRG
jgi:prevent-host-death family protein